MRKTHSKRGRRGKEESNTFVYREKGAWWAGSSSSELDFLLSEFFPLNCLPKCSLFPPLRK